MCTLASVALPQFVRADGAYDFEGLHAITKLAVRGADALIGGACYPTPEAMESALETRAIGVGGQGLADVFMALGLPLASVQARSLNIAIYEAIYHAAYEVSCELARQHGCYPLYDGSPASSGCLQHDMWPDVKLTGRYDFVSLRAQIDEYGLRNSMLTAQMPTASTAKLMGNFDGAEPYSRWVLPCFRADRQSDQGYSNVVVHRVLSGDYTEVCKWLVRDLERRGLWTEEIRLAVLKAHGEWPRFPGRRVLIKYRLDSRN